MNDEVSNPSHYNQNGIEVIDVIETYAKDDFRLANVIKYVCRCGYKGNKLQDLQKAYWYLNRVIEELVFAGYECRKQEEAEAEAIEKKDELYQTFVHPAPDRIAGDNDAAKEIKDSYYGFDRFAIKGHCANCDAAIRPSQPHVTSGAFEKGILFCSHACIEQLRDWQGR